VTRAAFCWVVGCFVVPVKAVSILCHQEGYLNLMSLVECKLLAIVDAANVDDQMNLILCTYSHGSCTSSRVQSKCCRLAVESCPTAQSMHMYNAMLCPKRVATSSKLMWMCLLIWWSSTGVWESRLMLWLVNGMLAFAPIS